MGFFTAPRLTWGPGALEQLSALEADRVVVIADPVVARHPHSTRLVEELRKTGATVDVTTDIECEPTVRSVEPAAEVLRRASPQWIVALGGGSTIDTAKAAWIRWVRPELDLTTVSPLVELNLRSRSRLVAVPTTNGSGSDASWQAHLWDSSGGLVELASRELVPDWATLDPEFSRTLSPTATANGAAEVLAHAAEALLSEWANPFSDAMAKEALSLATAHLPRLARHPEDDDTRAAVQYAATLAGLAASNASTGNAHALAHALHAATGLPHGRLVGIVLPQVVEFNFPSARDQFAVIGSLLGPSPQAYRGTVAARFRELLAAFGIPATLAEAGVDPDPVLQQMDSVVDRAMASTSARANPRVASREEWQDLVRRVTVGPPRGPAVAASPPRNG